MGINTAKSCKIYPDAAQLPEAKQADTRLWGSESCRAAPAAHHSAWHLSGSLLHVSPSQHRPYAPQSSSWPTSLALAPANTCFSKGNNTWRLQRGKEMKQCWVCLSKDIREGRGQSHKTSRYSCTWTTGAERALLFTAPQRSDYTAWNHPHLSGPEHRVRQAAAPSDLCGSSN